MVLARSTLSEAGSAKSAGKIIVSTDGDSVKKKVTEWLKNLPQAVH
ncbi:MAG: hypothetical protein N2053_03990 [Chitinispirillaceae bacterium]|nr:hypothetical protein [Chitinispirillaceae bacterium]